jgi:hypothetical protein
VLLWTKTGRSLSHASESKEQGVNAVKSEETRVKSDDSPSGSPRLQAPRSVLLLTADADLATLIRDHVLAKAPAHAINTLEFIRPERAMYQIGG